MKGIFVAIVSISLVCFGSCKSNLTADEAKEIIQKKISENEEVFKKACVGRLEIPNEGDRAIFNLNDGGFSVGVDQNANIYDLPIPIRNAVWEIGQLEYDARRNPYAFYSDSEKKHIERIVHKRETTIGSSVTTHYRFEGIKLDSIGSIDFESEFPLAILHFSLISNPFKKVKVPQIQGTVNFHKTDGKWNASLILPTDYVISDAMKSQILEAYKN